MWYSLVMSKLYIPVKILNKKYADKLVKGEVFMRSLYEFGLLSNTDEDKSEELKNNYRGDPYECASRIYAKPEDNPMFAKDPNFCKYAKGVYEIDDGDPQYFKIFSMYCLEFDTETRRFIVPDKRILEFGDTAVIFADFKTFMFKIDMAMFKEYNMHCFLIDRIKYYSPNETAYLNPIFQKRDSYAWQKELRIAVCPLDVNRPTSENKFKLIEDKKPILLNVGTNENLVYAISTKDLLNHKFPHGMTIQFPMEENNSIFNMMQNNTLETMKGYLTRSSQLIFHM